VYRARDTRLERSVAVKVLPADLSGRASDRLGNTQSSFSSPSPFEKLVGALGGA
jgi:hypothetical protein